MENKFSAIPIIMPLANTMQEAYPKVSKANEKLKNTIFNFFTKYAAYAIMFYSNMLSPRSAVRRTIDTMSPNFTMGFSNLPGPIKPLFYYNLKGDSKYYAEQSHTYIIPSGYIGLGIICMSFCESFKLTVTSDNGILTKE